MASVGKRPNGSWEVRWLDGDGRHRSKSVKSKADADKIRKQVEKCGTVTASFAEVTVEGACEMYIRIREREMSRGEIGEARYRFIIGLYERAIKKHIGSAKISRLDPVFVQRWVDVISGPIRCPEMSPVLVRGAVNILSAAITEAQRMGYVSRNIIKDVAPRLPKVMQAEPIDVPGNSDVVSLLRCATGQFGLMVEMAALTGMRAGEICALQWEHIDFDHDLIKVRCAMEPGTRNIKKPKSRAGIRDIPLTSGIRTKLMRHQSEQMNASLSNRREIFVFPERFRTPQIWNKAYQRQWRPLLKAAGLDTAFRFHSLRHYAASAMIAANMPPKRVQYIMGHASIQMTFDQYGRLFPDGGASLAALSSIESMMQSAKET